jgi:hypothetical protein
MFGGAALVRMVVIGAIITFVMAFIVSLRRQSSSRLPEKRWRGEPMDLGGGGDEARPWWRRWRGRR